MLSGGHRDGGAARVLRRVRHCSSFVTTIRLTRLHDAIAVCKATIRSCQLQKSMFDRGDSRLPANPGGQVGGTGGIVDVARPVVPQRPLGEDVFGHLRAIRTAPYREDVWALLGALCCWPCSDPASGQDPCHVRLSIGCIHSPSGCNIGMPYIGAALPSLEESDISMPYVSRC